MATRSARFPLDVAPPLRPARRVAGTMALAVAVALTLCAPISAAAAAVTGFVVDRAGKPVEFANVTVSALRVGTITDEQGRFSLDLPPGPVTIEVSQMGYQHARLSIADTGAGRAVRITLADEPVPVSEVVVTASSFGKVGKSEGATLRRMDVVMTPGGTADLFQSLRALPSINAPNEGAALYVRGGDPHETLIRLDGGELGHPYHYESSSGGLFSSFDSYMLKSAFFSSGGFSAKYGDALSGVLDIESQDPRNAHTVSVGANLVGVSASTSWALVPDRLTFVGSARLSRIELLDRLYGSASSYVSSPRSDDGAAKLLYRYSPTGRLALLYLGSGDGVEVVARRFNFDGIYSGHSHNDVGALQFQDAFGTRLAWRGQASLQRYSSGAAYGVLDTRSQERNGQGNLDAVWEASPRHEVSFGADLRRRASATDGTLPADSTDVGFGAATRLQSGGPVATSPGLYLEDKVRVWGPIYATVGARGDYASPSREWTFDPRASLAWRLDTRQTVRLATGRYHELPQARYLDRVYGNPGLRPMRADHVIAGYEWKSDYHNVRVEAFRKDYRDLITVSPRTYYTNQGHGYARGVDVFAQSTNRRLSGWVSYGYLDTRRKELDDPRMVPALYGVRHAATLVATWQARPALQVGARYGFSTGSVFTPVIGADYDPLSGRWHPRLGERNSDRLPDHHRLDVRITQLFSLPAAGGLPASSVCALYVEAMNLLGSHNVLEYYYSDDYSQRRTIESYFSRRILVAGIALTW